MTVTFELSRTAPDDLEVLAVPVTVEGMDRATDGDAPGLDRDHLRRRGFEGKVGQVQVLPGELGVVVVALGMGPAAAVGPTELRRAGAALARTVPRHRVVATTLLDALEAPQERAAGAQALAEGVALGAYGFHAYKSSPDPNRLERVVVVGTGGKVVQAALDRGQAIARGVAFARDLVNEPGGHLSAALLADRAELMATEAGLEVEVLDRKGIAKARLGGLLGVNRGSTQEPRLIRIRYEPTGRKRGTVALVGKGVTFDTGGYSIKTADGMASMKDDMGGAAAILGFLATTPVTAPKVAVDAIIPATDNMVSGDATRPGDVVTIRNGTTVEVLNTDAEGRLILADALVLASEAKPSAILDVATLTGACMVALGNRVAGLMGNRPSWVEQVRAAGERTAEPAWPLPLPTEYRRQLDSEVADLKNIGAGRYGGALVAGLFLQEFVGAGIPWAHLDIAGPAWSDSVDGVLPKGGTGFGVRLLVDLLHHYAAPTA